MKLFFIVTFLLPVSLLALATSTKSGAVVSIGEAIQQTDATLDDLLQTASRLWLPTDDSLPPHYRNQSVHHEKRQRWASQLLVKIGSLYNNEIDNIIEDDRLSRAIWAASMPFQEENRPEKEGRYVHEALVGIHTMLGKAFDNKKNNKSCENLNKDGILQLIKRAEAMASKIPSLAQVVEMRFAARGIIKRLSMEEVDLSDMDQRVSKLPFDICPLGVDWNSIIVPSSENNAVQNLVESIPFNFDTITTRTGSVVTERRGTAWVVDNDERIGALAYSGKLMAPKSPLPLEVAKAMRQVETFMSLPTPFFDCALCNHYPPGGEAACKFHTDPEHGTYWNRLTCVVAAGDYRNFAFRPIGPKTKWSDYDPIAVPRKGNDNVAATIPLFSGDVVQMWGECNDVFHHAVYAGGENSKDRVSLVLKQALDRGSGKRGHGLAGQGRRSRRRNSFQDTSTKTRRKKSNPPKVKMQ